VDEPKSGSPTGLGQPPKERAVVHTAHSPCCYPDFETREEEIPEDYAIASNLGKRKVRPSRARPRRTHTRLRRALYFSVSVAFNAHGNEAGGAARIAKFQQFIRFRVTKNGLTGFVIAIEKPELRGSKLEPRIVDEFTIAPATPVAV
jgi:hypothetical protein